MKTENFKQTIAQLRDLNKFLIIVGFVMLIVILIEGATIAYISTTRQTTFVPPTITSKFTVSSNSIDQSYLSQMAQYFAFLRFNVSPSTVLRNDSQLLNYVSPSSYHSISNTLSKESIAIQNDKISSSFFIKAVQVDTKNLRVKITGYMKKYVQSRELPKRVMTFVMQMSYRHGVLSLDSINPIENKK